MSDSEMTDADQVSDSGTDSNNTTGPAEQTGSTTTTSSPVEEELLAKMQEALVDERPPYCSGVIPVSPKDLILFYGDGTHSGRIDFSTNPSDSDLEKLMQACDPATFGQGDKDVYDESIRQAVKLDTNKFAAKLDICEVNSGTEGSEKAINILDAVRYGLLRSNELAKEKKGRPKWPPEDDGMTYRDVKAELYKLNVYGKGGFFKSHKDTPRATNMFGSLVIVLPTTHVGGELVFRRDSKEWIFDSAGALAKSNADPSIVYVTFFSDVEHEVLPVKEGYRVTLTYNLYFKEPVDEEKPIPRIPTEATFPPLKNVDLFRAALGNSLANGEFLPKGGMLGFRLQHLYPVFRDRWEQQSTSMQPYLKGFDALVLSICQEAGLKTRICFLYEDCLLTEKPGKQTYSDTDFISDLLEHSEGKLIDESYLENLYNPKDVTVYPVRWVTEGKSFNSYPTPRYGEGSLGNEPNIVHEYADLVLVADVGPTEKRKTVVDETPKTQGKGKKRSRE